MRVGAHFNVVITHDSMYPEVVMSDVGWLQALIKHADLEAHLHLLHASQCTYGIMYQGREHLGDSLQEPIFQQP